MARGLVKLVLFNIWNDRSAMNECYKKSKMMKAHTHRHRRHKVDHKESNSEERQLDVFMKFR